MNFIYLVLVLCLNCAAPVEVGRTNYAVPIRAEVEQVNPPRAAHQAPFGTDIPTTDIFSYAGSPYEREQTIPTPSEPAIPFRERRPNAATYSGPFGTDAEVTDILPCTRYPYETEQVIPTPSEPTTLRPAISFEGKEPSVEEAICQAIDMCAGAIKASPSRVAQVRKHLRALPEALEIYKNDPGVGLAIIDIQNYIEELSKLSSLRKMSDCLEISRNEKGINMTDVDTTDLYLYFMNQLSPALKIRAEYESAQPSARWCCLTMFGVALVIALPLGLGLGFYHPSTPAPAPFFNASSNISR